MVLKRHVAVAKAQGDVAEAIKRCNEYLKLFASDTQAVRTHVHVWLFVCVCVCVCGCVGVWVCVWPGGGPNDTIVAPPPHTHQPPHQPFPPQHTINPQWQELADLYLQANQPALAAFCLEELLLFQPSNFAFHTALAEAYYTAAGTTSSNNSGYVLRHFPSSSFTHYLPYLPTYPHTKPPNTTNTTF
jgi:tetratricopeptide (TPR) repeat protein